MPNDRVAALLPHPLSDLLRLCGRSGTQLADAMTVLAFAVDQQGLEDVGAGWGDASMRFELTLLVESQHFLIGPGLLLAPRRLQEAGAGVVSAGKG